MKAAALLLLALLTGMRLWEAAVTPVTPLEAYRWLCAHRLDWAFFDGPGGTAWIVWMTSTMLDQGPLGLRFAFPFFAAGASVGVFLLARASFGETVGIWAAAALNALPIFHRAAVHAGPELPALMLVLLAAWAFVRAMDRGVLWWLLGGMLAGAACLFHYAAIWLLPGPILACIICPRHRAAWLQPGLYLATAIPFFFLCPAWEWNRAHDWPALATGTVRTALTPRWSEILPALGANVAQWSIFASLALLAAIVLGVRSARIHARPRLALCLAGPFFLVWAYQLLQGSPGIFALLCVTGLLAGMAVHAFMETAPLRLAGIASLLLAAAGTTLPPSASADPWARSGHGIAWPEVAGSLSPIVDRVTSADGAPPLLIAQDADATSALNYHLSRTSHPEVFLRESQDVSNQFALWPRYDDFTEADRPADDFFKQEGSTTNPYIGRNALYLTEEDAANLPQTITAAFARVTDFATLELPGGRKMRVYFCENYQTMPL